MPAMPETAVNISYWRRRSSIPGNTHVGLTAAQFAEILDELEAGRAEAVEWRAWVARLEKARGKLYAEFKRLAEGEHLMVHHHHGDPFAECGFISCRSYQATLRMGNPRRKAARQ